MTAVQDGTRRLSAPPVIAEDQQGAVQCSPSRCVEANALRRMRGVLDARVGRGIMRLLRRDGWHRYKLTRNTKSAIRAYDDADQMIPIGFVAEFEPPNQLVGDRAGEKPGTNQRSGKRESVATRRPSSRHIDVEPMP